MVMHMMVLRRALLLAGLGLAIAFGAAADQRRPVAVEDRAWRAVGRINQGNGAFCTGVLIRADLVATAAHCLFHPVTGRRLAPEAVHFVAGWANGAAVAHRLGAQIAQSAAFEPGVSPTPEVMAADLALLQLASPIPRELVEPLPLTEPPAGERQVMVVSYARDRPHLASVETCRARFPTRPRRPVLADCASVEGASGAPVLIETPDGYAVAAILSGRKGEGEAAQAVATPLHPALNLLVDLLE